MPASLKGWVMLLGDQIQCLFSEYFIPVITLGVLFGSFIVITLGVLLIRGDMMGRDWSRLGNSHK